MYHTKTLLCRKVMDMQAYGYTHYNTATLNTKHIHNRLHHIPIAKDSVARHHATNVPTTICPYNNQASHSSNPIFSTNMSLTCSDFPDTRAHRQQHTNNIYQQILNETHFRITGTRDLRILINPKTPSSDSSFTASS